MKKHDEDFPLGEFLGFLQGETHQHRCDTITLRSHCTSACWRRDESLRFAMNKTNDEWNIYSSLISIMNKKTKVLTNLSPVCMSEQDFLRRTEKQAINALFRRRKRSEISTQHGCGSGHDGGRRWLAQKSHLFRSYGMNRTSCRRGRHRSSWGAGSRVPAWPDRAYIDATTRRPFDSTFHSRRLFSAAFLKNSR